MDVQSEGAVRRGVSSCSQAGVAGHTADSLALQRHMRAPSTNKHFDALSNSRPRHRETPTHHDECGLGAARAHIVAVDEQAAGELFADRVVRRGAGPVRGRSHGAVNARR